MFTTREQIRQSLLDAGVSKARAEPLAAAAKPCASFETRRVQDESEIPLGATKIGGRPDLPIGMSWPVRLPYPDAQKRIGEARDVLRRISAAWPDRSEGAWAEADRQHLATANASSEEKALSFIAQIDFESVHRCGDLDRDLPHTGRLMLFYDAEIQPWGVPSDRFGWRIFYDETDAFSLSRTPFPAELSDSDDPLVFRPLTGEWRWCMTPVPFLGFEYPDMDLDDPDHERLTDWWIEVGEKGAWRKHQVGGHPNQVQNEMQTECQLVSNGLPSHPRDSPEAKRLASGAKDWFLLCQVASDEESGMLWGDSGYLYFWIRRDDLRARRFDGTWVILQCF